MMKKESFVQAVSQLLDHYENAEVAELRKGLEEALQKRDDYARKAHEGKKLADLATLRCGEALKEVQAYKDIRDLVEPLVAVGEAVATQDNLATDQPMFVVQQRLRIYGISSDYADGFDWLNEEGDVLSAEAAADRLVGVDGESCRDGWPRKVYYKDIWEHVTTCFTRRGCEAFLAINGHNLRSPRIYVEGSYRNLEWQLVRKIILAIAKAFP